DPAWSSHWQSSLEAGEVLLLLDGLDEVSDAGVRERVFAIFRDAESHWPNCTMVVTSRPFAAEKLESMGFHRVVIDPFGAAETREFINRWSAALYNHPIEVEPFGEAGEKAGAMKKAILDRPAIRKLAANPVMLTCLCVVHWNRGQLPEGRSLVYKVVISWLLNSHEEIRKSHGYNNRFALEAFSAIAFAMMGGRKGNKRATFDLQETCEIVRPLVTRYFSDVGFSQVCDFISEWLRFEALHSNILLEKNKDQFGFWHLTFQEYLAAQELAWMRDDRDSGWWPVVADRLEDAQWRETIDLFPGVLLDGGGSNKVDDLLSRVQKKYSGRKLADAARMAGVMGRILEPIKVYQYRPQAEIQKRYQRVLDRAMDIFTLEGAT
ncbi:MAG TPA: hypothetical protein HPQ00_17835, partial [Magnetococcales bacterium]|nr:hypothetical protein [Magnetococcales bacterium]